MLHMVLRLMSDGGDNPICARRPDFAGCGVTNAALGFPKASQILFDTVGYYAPSTARWEDLATYASEAAFELYSNCDTFPKLHATGEQAAVNRAFTKIGYPRLVGALSCS